MTREQRCWVHKTANVLNKLPNSLHAKAKRALQEIWMAETKNVALVASFFGCQYDYTTHTHTREDRHGYLLAWTSCIAPIILFPSMFLMFILASKNFGIDQYSRQGS